MLALRRLWSIQLVSSQSVSQSVTCKCEKIHTSQLNKSMRCQSFFFSVSQQGKVKGEVEVTRRRGRRLKKLLHDLKDRRGHSHLNEEALDLIMWRNCFGRGVGPVDRQITV